MITPVYRGDCFLYPYEMQEGRGFEHIKEFIFLFHSNPFTFVLIMTINNTYNWQFSFYYYFSKNAGACV